jgi:type I restriction enzyme S subunit
VVHINSRALAAIRVQIPSRAEQDAIAEVIQDSDHAIDLAAQRLRKAQAIRMAMMQQLLTGRSRLGMTEAAA